MSLQSAMSVRFNSAGTQLLALRRRLPPVLYELHSRLPSFQFDNQGYFNSCTMKSCCFAGDRDQVSPLRGGVDMTSVAAMFVMLAPSWEPSGTQLCAGRREFLDSFSQWA